MGTKMKIWQGIKSSGLQFTFKSCKVLEPYIGNKTQMVGQILIEVCNVCRSYHISKKNMHDSSWILSANMQRIFLRFSVIRLHELLYTFSYPKVMLNDKYPQDYSILSSNNCTFCFIIIYNLNHFSYISFTKFVRTTS